VAFTDLGQVYYRLGGRPGVGSDGYLHAETAFAETHTVNRFWVQIIRDELVVALEIPVRDVEEQRPVLRLNTLSQNRNRTLMTFQQRRQKRRHEGFIQNLRQGLGYQERNESGDETVFLRRFDHHGQFHGGRFHFDRGLG